MKKLSAISTAVLATLTLCAVNSASAEEWSDTSIGYRYGTHFQEPFNGSAIAKSIVNFEHVGGYKYGTNFFNIDVLQSNSVDGNAAEAYIVYRNTLDFGKLGANTKMGPLRSIGLTGGFDLNTKNDTGYASKKHMLVLGPTLMWDGVPGFLNTSLLLLDESNFPKGISSRYSYKLHPELDVAWGIDVAPGLQFAGYFDYIASKGNNEFGGPTEAETHFDGKLMYDIGNVTGMGKKALLVGLDYEYWTNKFGNPSSVPGSKASTPMIRLEYHF